jgi:hypothetical protein
MVPTKRGIGFGVPIQTTRWFAPLALQIWKTRGVVAVAAKIPILILVEVVESRHPRTSARADKRFLLMITSGRAQDTTDGQISTRFLTASLCITNLACVVLEFLHSWVKGPIRRRKWIIIAIQEPGHISKLTALAIIRRIECIRVGIHCAESLQVFPAADIGGSVAIVGYTALASQCTVGCRFVDREEVCAVGVHLEVVLVAKPDVVFFDDTN